MNYLGIDIGTNGGLALISADGEIIDVCKMPETHAETVEVLREWTVDPVVAVIETVGASPQMGRSSCFTFGRNDGVPRGALYALRVKFREVSPAVWQREFGLPRGSRVVGRSPSAKKAAHREKAAQLFPLSRPTNATADALLLAEWLRREEGR